MYLQKIYSNVLFLSVRDAAARCLFTVSTTQVLCAGTPCGVVRLPVALPTETFDHFCKQKNNNFT